MFKREINQTHENFLGPAVPRVSEEVLDMVACLDSDGLRRQASTVVRPTVVTFFGLIGTVTAGFLRIGLFHLADLTLLEKALSVIAVVVPVTALTLYTAAKSPRLAEFL